MKKRALFLNLSLIFGIAYHALFIAGYLLQKPLFGWQFPPETLEQIETVYCMPVIAVTAVCGIVFAVLVLLMRKNASRGLFVGAIMLSGGAFIVERIANNIAANNIILLNKLNAENGELGVIAYGLNRTAVAALDMFLLPLFAAAIVLMCCAACISETNTVENV